MGSYVDCKADAGSCRSGKSGEHYIGLLYSYVGNVWDSACHCVLSQSLLLLLGEGCAGGWWGRYSKTFQRMDYNRFPEAGSRF